jgi:ribonuclease VapC
LIIDTSALLAIAFREHRYETILDAIERAKSVSVSAVSLYEAGVVLYGRTHSGQRIEDLFGLVQELRIQVLAFDEQAARSAIDAFRRYGKGIHPARLNLGDCPAYALANSMGLPLLFKGDDFARTDIMPAI